MDPLYFDVDDLTWPSITQSPYFALDNLQWLVSVPAVAGIHSGKIAEAEVYSPGVKAADGYGRAGTYEAEIYSGGVKAGQVYA